MKLRNQIHPFRAAIPNQCLGTYTIAFAFFTAGHAFAQNTWNGTTNAKWNEPTNWSTAAIPATGEVLNFGGTPANFPTDNDIAGLTTGAINFTNNGTSGQTATFALGTTGQSITLGGNVTTTGPAASTTNLTDVINMNLVLDANRTVTPNRANNLNHNLTINGEISGAFTLIKAGNASLTLTNAANSFNDLTVAGAANGFLNVNTLSDSGVPSAIGSGTAIGLNGGTLVFNGTANASTNRTINFSISNSGVFNSGSGGVSLSLTGTFTNATVGAKTFVLGGDSGSNAFQGSLANASDGGVLSFSKTGFSTWILTGNNTHTGAVLVASGSLTVGSISDSGASNLGQGTLLTLGTGAQTGTLNFTGNSASTARQLVIGVNTTNFTGGASINANGALGGTGLKFTNPAFNVTTAADATATRTLTLSGSNTDANEVVGVIKDGNINLKTGVIKSGAGSWILAGANSYTGPTSMSGGGLLLLNNGSALGAANLTLSGGVLGLGADNFTRGLGLGAGQVQFTTTAASGFAAFGANRFVNLGGASATVVWASAGNFFIPANNNTMSLGHATATHTLDFQNPIDLNAFTRTFVVADGAAAVDAQLSGALTGASGSNFAKSGAGVLVISGANTYAGSTTVTAGTLRLGASDCLPTTAVSIAAATLDVSTFTDTAGTLDVTAASTIQIGNGGTLAFSASAGIDWTGGTLNVTGTFVPGSSIRFGSSSAGLTATQLGLISINGVPGALLDSNGYLIVGSDPYTTWSGGAPFDGDANNDGVQNGLAWLLGAANPTFGALPLLPTMVQSGGSLQMNFSMLNAAGRGAAAVDLQHSSDLGISDLWTGVLVPNTSGGPTSGVTFVITPGSPLNGVQATISSSESAGGKLFGRLKAVK
jgi:autotransporter-associated beta strand protein